RPWTSTMVFFSDMQLLPNQWNAWFREEDLLLNRGRCQHPDGRSSSIHSDGRIAEWVGPIADNLAVEGVGSDLFGRAPPGGATTELAVFQGRPVARAVAAGAAVLDQGQGVDAATGDCLFDAAVGGSLESGDRVGVQLTDRG